jgi:cell division protein FtsN
MAQARRVRRRTASSRPHRPTPGWVWLLSGMLVGLAVAAVLYLQGADRMARDFGALTRSDPPAPAAPAREAGPDAVAPASERSRFQFYELLPRDEVTVPRPSTPAPGPAATAPAAPPTAAAPAAPAAPATPAERPATRILLQTGSFREFTQADEMKARLAMMGLQANIRQVQVEGQTFHRVYLGPFENETQADRWADRLRRENIEVLRLPAPG